ncbi:hypothetical protein HZS_4909 [Henneguya salminicola]|nr:hypothetical protein HZS_4909 [Henneguya salminicola]
MSPFQIKESSFSRFSPRPKKINSVEDNQKNIEKLCFEINQALLLGGKQSENYCAYLVNNYDTFKRVAENVYSMNKTSQKPYKKVKVYKEEEEQEEEISSSCNDDSTDDDSYSKEKHEKPRKIILKNENHQRNYEKHNFNSKQVQDGFPYFLEMYDTRDEKQIPIRSSMRDNNKLATIKMVHFTTDFDRLTHDETCKWLISNGCEFVGANLPKSIKSGYEFRTMSDNEWAKELGITNEMDRKRLRLSIQKLIENPKEKSISLSGEWVAQWLDDIGLSQYKYEFLRRKINGQVLNNLTFKEIRLLGIYNPLHQCSLKRSIQLMRQQKFHPCYLKTHANINNRKNIAFWTISDIASWLKNMKLPHKIKYARENGLNGALILLEPRFNSTTMIDVLKVKSKKNKRKIKNEFEKLLPYLVLQDKETQFRSNIYMPIFKNAKEEKKYSEMWASVEADDLPLCAMNLDIDPKFKVPEPLGVCPIHQIEQQTTNPNQMYSNTGITDKGTYI